MNVLSVTNLDCYAAARRKTVIITCQRKVNRLLARIYEKESYAALYKSKFMCERYDEEIEALYSQVAELEGHAMANELELEQFEAKRREDEAQRIVRLLHLTAPTLEPAAAPSPPAPTAPRTEQLSMFGPGPAPIDTKPLGQLSAADREHAVENDIALGIEMAFESPEPKSESALAVMAPASSSAVAAKPMFAYSFPPTTVAPESKGPAKQSSATPSPVAGPVVPSEVAASQVRQSQPVTKSPETVPDTRPLTTAEDKGSSTDHTD